MSRAAKPALTTREGPALHTGPVVLPVALGSVVPLSSLVPTLELPASSRARTTTKRVALGASPVTSAEVTPAGVVKVGELKSCTPATSETKTWYTILYAGVAASTAAFQVTERVVGLLPETLC